MRKNLVYPKNFYYCAIAGDFVFRILWTLTISPSVIEVLKNSNVLSTALAGCEIARRTGWNLIRLENEQLNNVGKFRAINISVPLVPIDGMNEESVKSS